MNLEPIIYFIILYKNWLDKLGTLSLLTMKCGTKSRVGLAILNIILNGISLIEVFGFIFALIYFLGLLLINLISRHFDLVFYIIIFAISTMICFIFSLSAIAGIVGNSFAICPINSCGKKASYVLLVLHIIGLSITLVLGIIGVILTYASFSHYSNTTEGQSNINNLILIHVSILIILMFRLFFASLLITLESVLIFLIKKAPDANVPPLQVPLIENPAH